MDEHGHGSASRCVSREGFESTNASEFGGTQGPGRSSVEFGNSQRAPMLPVRPTTSQTQWFADRSMRSVGSRRPPRTAPCWRPLASAWREWDETQANRDDADDGSTYVDGCVPNWSKGASVRMRNLVERELNVVYGHMQRHVTHPLRQQVGESLPPTDVLESMRNGQEQFQFWRDLRPPFYITDMKRADILEDEDTDLANLGNVHPDGELFFISYQCGLDYMSERKWGQKQSASTFNNKINGVAKVRIPDTFPGRGGIRIITWGEPVLAYTPAGAFETGHSLMKNVSSSTWMPIAGELGIRADSTRLAACREVSRRAGKSLHLSSSVPELQKALLGPHAGLPHLAKLERLRAESTAPGGHGNEHHGSRSTLRRNGGGRTRQHRIWTSAAGFVKYAG